MSHDKLQSVGEPRPRDLAQPAVGLVGNGGGGSQVDLDLMLDPWSGNPLNFARSGEVGGGAAADTSSIGSIEVTSTSVRTDPSVGSGPELRRFAQLQATVGASATEKDPMDRTTSPVPFESKKVLPVWHDADFTRPPQEGAGDVDAAAGSTRVKVSFAPLASSFKNTTPRTWTPSPEGCES